MTEYRPPKFDFFEKVVVASPRPQNARVREKLGAVLGRSRSDEGVWGYTVSLYEENESWDFLEDELRSTGEFDRKETFYSGDSVRVRVDEEGRGRIAADEE